MLRALRNLALVAAPSSLVETCVSELIFSYTSDNGCSEWLSVSYSCGISECFSIEDGNNTSISISIGDSKQHASKKSVVIRTAHGTYWSAGSDSGSGRGGATAPIGQQLTGLSAAQQFDIHRDMRKYSSHQLL